MDLKDFSLAKKEIEGGIQLAKSELEALKAESDADAVEQKLQNAISIALTTLQSPSASLEDKNNAARSVIENCTFDKETSTLTVTYRVII